MFGKLIVKVKSAKLTHDTELIGKMDPYCQIKFGGQTHRTRTHKRGGKVPKWEELFQFDIQGERELSFACYDEEKYKKDDFIGEGVYSLEDVFSRLKIEDQARLQYKNKSAGVVHLDLEFRPVAAPVETSVLRLSRWIYKGIMNLKE